MAIVSPSRTDTQFDNMKVAIEKARELAPWAKDISGCLDCSCISLSVDRFTVKQASEGSWMWRYKTFSDTTVEGDLGPCLDSLKHDLYPEDVYPERYQ